MISHDLLKAAKLRIRKEKTDVLDEDVRGLAETAIADLKRIGVADRFLSACTDPIIKEAILTYIKANYGNNPDREKLMSSYGMYLTKIKGGKYRE